MTALLAINPTRIEATKFVSSFAGAHTAGQVAMRGTHVAFARKLAH
jgi:hypothetical protein